MKVKNLYHCPTCKERSLETKKSVKHNAEEDECERCYSDISKYGLYRFGKANKMDPFPYGFHWFIKNLKLSAIEEMLISPVITVFKAYQLPSGVHKYRGNVVNFEQDVKEFATALPRRVGNLPVSIIVRKSNPTFPSGYKDFKVDRAKIQFVLEYLNEVFPDTFEIDIAALNALPQNGSVQDQIPVIEEDDISDINEDTANNTNNNSTNETATNNDNANDPSTGEPPQGPDHSGATGIPENERSEIEQDYIAQPVQQPVDVEQVLRQTLNMSWPQQGTAPISDYNTPGIQSKAFPLLFPRGDGDATLRDRPVGVKLMEANQHLLWYAVPREDGNGFFYPFADHARWPFWSQNTVERHRFQKQKQVYMDKNPEDVNLTADEIQTMIDNNDQNSLQKIMSKMSVYCGNMLGSDAYFSNARKELESLMEGKGMPTLWFTFSAADNHWTDLHEISSSANDNTEENSLNEKEKAKRRRKYIRENQHIVDSYFFYRIKRFLEIFFGEEGLDAAWKWFRIEYQGRGAAHAHGCCRLKSDPDLTKLGRKVYLGRKAQRMLQENNSNDLLELKTKGLCFTSDDRLFDTWKNVVDNSDFPLNPSSVEKLQQAIVVGKKAQDTIIRYNDFIVTTMHPDPPSDANETVRDDETAFKQTDTNIHPANIDPRNIENMSLEERDIYYGSNINAYQRHKHGSYCKKSKDTCRGNFPKTFQNITILAVKENKNGRATMELLTKCNDGWINPHSRVFLEFWQANIDLRLTIDIGKIVGYMTKYVNKTETNNNAKTKRLLHSKFKRIARENTNDTAKILSKVMNEVRICVFRISSRLFISSWNFCSTMSPVFSTIN